MDLNGIIKNSRISVVDEVEYGTYLWKMPDGTYLADADQNFLSIFSMRNDLVKISRLSSAARSYGVDEGQAVFFAGMRQIDDDEYESQKQRLAAGEIPDEFDISSLKDSIKAKEAGLTDD
jgi:hypothetical protein